MRPLLVSLLAIAIFGLLAGYERFVATLPSASSKDPTTVAAKGTFSVELTLSFQAAKDEFALADDPAVSLRIGGQDLIRADHADIGQRLEAANVSGIVAGRNAFFVRAIPDKSDILHAC